MTSEIGIEALRIARKALTRAEPYIHAFRDQVGPAVGFPTEALDAEVESITAALEVIDAVLIEHRPWARAEESGDV